MLKKAAADDFSGRFREIISDPLNLLIERVPEAGYVEDNLVCLHNGIKVPYSGPGAYYDGFSQILCVNRGVHEPLEEYVFQQLLRALPPAPVMLELGAYWGHYSMWLKRAHPQATVYLVEPEAENIEAGRQNFRRNGMDGHFIQDFVDATHFRVDHFMREQGLQKLDILHSDIQGFEVQMLQCCERELAEHRIDRAFISTHSQELHAEVMRILRSHGYRVEVAADFDEETTSYDGLVFASSPAVAPLLPGFRPLSRPQIANSSPAALLQSLAGADPSRVRT